jgi:alanine dehydrogenase
MVMGLRSMVMGLRSMVIGRRITVMDLQGMVMGLRSMVMGVRGVRAGSVVLCRGCVMPSSLTPMTVWTRATPRWSPVRGGCGCWAFRSPR